jgi:hypothetical protein
MINDIIMIDNINDTKKLSQGQEGPLIACLFLHPEDLPMINKT